MTRENQSVTIWLVFCSQRVIYMLELSRDRKTNGFRIMSTIKLLRRLVRSCPPELLPSALNHLAIVSPGDVDPSLLFAGPMFPRRTL